MIVQKMLDLFDLNTLVESTVNWHENNHKVVNIKFAKKRLCTIDFINIGNIGYMFLDMFLNMLLINFIY